MATEFQRRVWDALRRIPKGRVTTYGAIAAYLGTKAVRAVGTAVGKNPYAPEVPCHRVVPSNGKLGNYSGEGGAARKEALLESEGVRVKKGKIVDFERVLYDFANAKRRTGVFIGMLDGKIGDEDGKAMRNIYHKRNSLDGLELIQRQRRFGLLEGSGRFRIREDFEMTDEEFGLS